MDEQISLDEIEYGPIETLPEKYRYLLVNEYFQDFLNESYSFQIPESQQNLTPDKISEKLDSNNPDGHLLQHLYEIIKIAAQFSIKKSQTAELFKFWGLREIQSLGLERKYGIFAPKIEKIGEKVAKLPVNDNGTRKKIEKLESDLRGDEKLMIDSDTKIEGKESEGRGIDENSESSSDSETEEKTKNN